MPPAKKKRAPARKKKATTTRRKKPTTKPKRKPKRKPARKKKTTSNPFEKTQFGKPPFKSIFNGIKPNPSGGKTRYRPRTKRGGKKALWSSVAPKTTAERRKIKAKCGSKCFGAPATLGYPICTSSSCKPDPRGIEAARSRAKQFDHRKGKIGSRARGVLKKLGK